MESSEKPVAKQLRIVRWYTAAAILLLNTIVVLVVLNVIVWAGLAARRLLKSGNPVTGKYDEKSLAQIYAPRPEDEWKQILRETWERPMRFEQFVQLRERPYHGKFVNVSENGYRIGAPQGPWPIDKANYNIFVFGGSTTFGYGVADNETIPAHLQEILNAGKPIRPICIYNFGRGFFFTTPERILFEQLLQNGSRPDLAIFIDGINDFFHANGEFQYSEQISRAVDVGSQGAASHLVGLFQMTPIGLLATSIHTKSQQAAADKKPFIPSVIERYLWNKRSIELVAGENNVATQFVWQPTPVYEWDLKYHLFVAGDLSDHWIEADGYKAMAQHLAEDPLGEDFLWLADMQKGVQKPLYCDQIHYSAGFCGDIAQEIAKRLARRKLPS